MTTTRQPAPITSSDMVAAALLERILKGEWQVGQRIPSVDRLEQSLPVSRVTICRGIQKLVRQGYLRGVRGSGTYVSSTVLLRRVLLHVGGDPRRHQAHPFGSVVTRKLEALLAGREAQVEIHWEARRPLAGSRLAADLTEAHFSGVISIASNLPPMIKSQVPQVLGRVPLVHVGVHREVPWVDVDVAAFNRHALAWCRRQRARRVLYFAPTGSAQATDFARQAGRLAWHTLDPADGDCSTEPTEDEGFKSFRRAWRRLGGQCDAIVIPDDILTKGITQGLLTLGPEVAARVAVLTLANQDSGVFYPLPVTTIEVNTDEVAARALALLERQLLHGALPASAGSAVAPHPTAAHLAAID
jgi:DNA-binding LacI/PurR family transcriptional regulator